MPSPVPDPQRLLDHVPGVVVLGSNDGTIEWVSPSVRHALGWEPDDLVGATFPQLVHPDDAQRVRAVQRDFLNGVATGGSVRLRRSDNTYQWMAVDVHPLVGEHGQVTGRVASWHNIQSHFDERAHLHTIIERLQSALHAMAEPYVEDGLQVVDHTTQQTGYYDVRITRIDTDDVALH